MQTSNFSLEMYGLQTLTLQELHITGYDSTLYVEIAWYLYSPRISTFFQVIRLAIILLYNTCRIFLSNITGQISMFFHFYFFFLNSRNSIPNLMSGQDLNTAREPATKFTLTLLLPVCPMNSGIDNNPYMHTCITPYYCTLYKVWGYCYSSYLESRIQINKQCWSKLLKSSLCPGYQVGIEL